MLIGLRTRILLPALAAVIFSMGLAGFLAAHRASEELWTELEAAALSVCSSVTIGLHSFVSDLQALAIMRAGDDGIVHAVQNNSPEALSKAKELLQSLRKVSPAVQGANLLNAKGDVMVSSEANATGNFSDRAYFKKAMNGEANVSDPLLSRVTGRPVFIVAAPVIADGRVLGVLYLRLDIGEFSRLNIEPIRIGQEGYAYLVDRTGKMLSHPNPEYILKFDINEFDWGRRIMAQESGKVSYILDGVEKNVVFVREKSSGWTLAITINRSDITRAMTAVRNNALLSTACGSLLVCVIIYLVVQKMLGSLQQCVNFADAVSAGDLERRLTLTRHDELGKLAQALNLMVEKLKGTLDAAHRKSVEAEDQAKLADEASTQAREALARAACAQKEGLRSAAEQIEGVVEIVSSASEEISSQIEYSSNGAVDQASRVQNTAAAMEEMSATVDKMSRSAEQAAETSEIVRSRAESGAVVVEKMVAGIGLVEKQALALKIDMSELGTQAEGIGNVLNMISDIADQTNLLALNAAIEAARAGDAGKGFAVVADEVRKLAEKTMSATKEVDAAVRGIQGGTRKNVENVERSVQTIAESTELAVEARRALSEIVNLVDQATVQTRNIATAAQEQASATAEVTLSVEDIQRISLETAEAMRQSTVAMNELASQTIILRSLVDRLKHD